MNRPFAEFFKSQGVVVPDTKPKLSVNIYRTPSSAYSGLRVCYICGHKFKPKDKNPICHRCLKAKMKSSAIAGIGNATRRPKGHRTRQQHKRVPIKKS